MDYSRLLIGAVFSMLTAAPVPAQFELKTRPISRLPEDPAAEMVAGMHRFLDIQTEKAAVERESYWKNAESLEANRDFLERQLGLEPVRYQQDGLLFESPAIATCEAFDVSRVRWPVLAHPAPQTADVASLWGEGIHLGNRSGGSLMILVPDASEDPEDFLPGHQPTERQRFVARLAASMDVLIIDTISHRTRSHGGVRLSRRDYLHRAAFELGRTLSGYEIQTVQSVIDRWNAPQKVIVCGFGEGARTALMTGAIDQRVDLTMVGSYFENRDGVAAEPLSRQVFGVLNRFSDAHLAALITPRGFVEFQDRKYSVQTDGKGAAPSVWASPDRHASSAEYERFRQLVERLDLNAAAAWSVDGGLQKTVPAIRSIVGQIDPIVSVSLDWNVDRPTLQSKADERENRLLAMIDSHNQLLLAESDYERGGFMNLGHSRTVVDNPVNQLETLSPEAYEESIRPFRQHFREQTIGWYEQPLDPMDARSVETYRGDGWTSYGVMLDVFPEVFAYGELLVPDGIAADEKRPVVVCQHGLEGRPQDTMFGDHRAYHDFAAKLAREGFIVFAPQNPYIGGDDFRSLQRKSYPIGKTLFSIIGAQHQQIINWLQLLANVDPDRIAFYGLSYGGKSAMRLPALLPEYCLSICSADFNDWVWKNASSRSRYSYIGTSEYEIFEFGLGKTFNYAEMAALIAPRPFMVERGHFDGVAPDDRVAKEFAKVRYLYQARLKLGDRCRIEFFDGPHTINGKGTFEFLRRHLKFNAD